MRVLLVGFAIFIGMPSLAYAQPPCAPIYWCREGIAGVTGMVANGDTVANDGGAMVHGEITIGMTMTTTTTIKENTASHHDD